MSTENLDNIWKEASTTGTGTDDVSRLIRKAQASDRRWKIRMGLFGFNLALATALGIWGTVSGRSNLSESWPAAVALLALLATYVEFIRFRMNESARYESMRRDLKSALQRTLTKAMASSREIRILLAVNVLTVVPLTIVSVQNLLGADKMTAQQAVSFAIFCSIIFTANIAFLTFQYFVKLRPQCDLLQKRVESLPA